MAVLRNNTYFFFRHMLNFLENCAVILRMKDGAYEPIGDEDVMY